MAGVRYGKMIDSPSLGRESREPIDKGGEIGARISKEILDPPVSEELQIGLSHIVNGNRNLF